MPLCSPSAEEDLLLYGEQLFDAALLGGMPKSGPRAVPYHGWDRTHSDLGLNIESDLSQGRNDSRGGGVVYFTLCRCNGRVEVYEVSGEGVNATMQRVFTSNSAISRGAVIAWDDSCRIDDE